MTLEWTTYNCIEFPDSDIKRICNKMRKNGWNAQVARDEVLGIVDGFDDCDYCAWGEDQTKAVINEIKRRIGGIQLSMFNDPFGVPEDYNEGWQ